MIKIVFIEDNIDVRETTQEILELSNYKVFACENGKDGIESVIKEKPDIILCDIGMLGVDGHSVLSVLSRNLETCGIPFIFLTADTDFRKGMNLGADDYIIKPFKESELIGAIEARLSRNKNLKSSSQEILEDLSLFFDDVSATRELEELTKNRKIINYKKKAVIYREGDYSNYLYFILKGKVKCVKMDTYGKEFINDIHSKGAFLGYLALLEDGDYSETIITIENTEIVKILKKDFIALVQKNRNVAMKFIKTLSKSLRDREERLLLLAYTPVRERVVERILNLENNHKNNGKAPSYLEISRNDLASMVGTATETLNRNLSELKKENLIDTNKSKIVILNKAGLQKIANNRTSC